ncbi:hypothetical protein KX729_19340 [Rhizobium sp. XQZ8]|uniref:hypothetical protein n=1 Tax=Rhizobium populisoli TaxID=2859785 RepID=UPI001CA59D82|nr:hypothetical protein [Rhizobium populisoli]MBW6423617.1 hypothetical protein [Rhizobium populisoli]
MRRELSIPDAVADPLIAQLRRADGISDQAFAMFLLDAADAYRAGAISKLHRRRVDLFYKTIGAGLLDLPHAPKVTEWRFQGSTSEW